MSLGGVCEALAETQTSHDLIEEYLLIWNERAYDRLPDVVAESFVLHSPTAGDIEGPSGLEQFLRGLHAGFPDLQVTINDLLVSDEVGMADGTLAGTHEGEFVGIPPSGNEVSIDFMDKYRFEAGKLRYHRPFYNVLAFLKQLGVTPE